MNWLLATDGELINTDYVVGIKEHGHKNASAYMVDGTAHTVNLAQAGGRVKNMVAADRHFVPAMPGERATVLTPDGEERPVHLIGWRVSVDLGGDGNIDVSPVVAYNHRFYEDPLYLMRVDRDGSSALYEVEAPDVFGLHSAGSRDQVNEEAAEWRAVRLAAAAAARAAGK